jgi:hypothetical protein
MNAAALNAALTLGAITGMRTMAGPAALAARYDGAIKNVVAVLAAGEMIPLAGRAVAGALVGGMIARYEHGNIVLGAATGAAAAIVAAHVAFRLRQRLPFSNAVNGLVEDSVVTGIAALYASRRRGHHRK